MIKTARMRILAINRMMKIFHFGLQRKTKLNKKKGVQRTESKKNKLCFITKL